jgi:hypothetical protein
LNYCGRKQKNHVVTSVEFVEKTPIDKLQDELSLYLRQERVLDVFGKDYLRAVSTGQVKLVICYWPNTGQRVANGTIPLQLRARNSNKTREQR